MAQKVITVLTDDVTGEELKDGETVEFSLDGVTYQLDLGKKNADKFRGLFQDYIAVARKVSGGRKASSSGRKSSGANPETKAIKEWAEAQGIDYPKRGRLPQSLIDQWKSAGH